MDGRITIRDHDDSVEFEVLNGDGVLATFMLDSVVAGALGGLLVSAAHLPLQTEATFATRITTGDEKTADTATQLQLHPVPAEDEGPAAAEPAVSPSEQQPDASHDPAPITPEVLAGLIANVRSTELVQINGVGIPAEYAHLADLSPDDTKWKVTGAARGNAAKAKMTEDDLIVAAREPETITPSDDRPGVNIHKRGDVCVLIPKDQPHVIIGAYRAQAHSARMLAPAPGGGGLPKASSGGVGKRVPTSVSELHRILGEHGFSIERKGHQPHAKITHASMPGVSLPIPGSPSDYRSFLNLVAQVRRVFSIDITGAAG